MNWRLFEMRGGQRFGKRRNRCARMAEAIRDRVNQPGKRLPAVDTSR